MVRGWIRCHSQQGPKSGSETCNNRKATAPRTPPAPRLCHLICKYCLFLEKLLFLPRMPEHREIVAYKNSCLATCEQRCPCASPSAGKDNPAISEQIQVGSRDRNPPGLYAKTIPGPGEEESVLRNVPVILPVRRRTGECCEPIALKIPARPARFRREVHGPPQCPTGKPPDGYLSPAIFRYTADGSIKFLFRRHLAVGPDVNSGFRPKEV